MRHRRSVVLRARSSCGEASENRSEQGPDCTGNDQTAPIRNHSRTLEFEWLCAGRVDGNCMQAHVHVWRLRRHHTKTMELTSWCTVTISV
ncbi:hypothetical protein AVEN_267098-1 [Araneus ventricosus]|uniref:Uncharacterized protein n=1 Tax=Araneus ventricosus TaxID=182803 RepID=A0A4Y2T3G7_ARAVE|nr:hypothetical protein AVEN_267098-1 [Araneus ventricosus]